MASSFHRAVAMLFVPNPDNKPEVNHKDGNKLNNSASNLEWVTAKENQEHEVQTMAQRNGEKQTYWVKLTEEQVIALYNEAVLHPEMTHKELGDKYGLHKHYVGLILNGREWRHLHLTPFYKKFKAVVGTNLTSGEELRLSKIADCKQYGFDSSCICACCKGKLKSHRGWAWRYDTTT